MYLSLVAIMAKTNFVIQPINRVVFIFLSDSTKLRFHNIFSYVNGTYSRENRSRSFELYFYLCLFLSGTISLCHAQPTPPMHPLGREAWLTSSFGESRGNRYHAGIDYGTEMEEGWPVLAPENGVVEEVRISPFGYGKVLFFKGSTGTWVLAHLSDFANPIDSVIQSLRIRRRSNQLSHRINRNNHFRKGDTLGWSGSTGIGNPHLHLELRQKNKVVDPCRQGVSCPDSVFPILQGLAIWDEQKSGTLIQSQPEHVAEGCLPIEANTQNPVLAIRAVDYSRIPTTNPMSLRRLEVRCGNMGYIQRLHARLNMSQMSQILEEMLWAEEGPVPGDWHLMHSTSPFTANTRAQGSLHACLLADSTGVAKDSLEVELEDFSGNVTAHKLLASTRCRTQQGKLPFIQFQDSLLFTYLGRAWLDPRIGCQGGHSLHLLDSLEQPLLDSLCPAIPRNPVDLAVLFEVNPQAHWLQLHSKEIVRSIRLERTGEEVSFNQQNFNLRLSPKTVSYPVVIAAEWRNNKSDSLPHLLIHPKGLPLKKPMDVCLQFSDSLQSIYWLGETSRQWFLFSTGKKQKEYICVQSPDLRDVALRKDTLAPVPGQLRNTTIMVRGKPVEALRIPVLELGSGIPHGNAVQAFQDTRWIPAEYDSDPREIILEVRHLTTGIPILLHLEDEMGNRATYSLPY